MTLEDQIRRMGEARAAEVSTPSWRDHVGGEWGVPRRWVGAAAAILVLAVGVLALLSDDESQTEVAGPDSGLRWIPAAGVERIDYPGDAAFFAQFIGWPEVALVTPGGRTDVAAEEVTRLFGGSSRYRRSIAPADGFRVSTRPNGIVELDLDRGDDFTVAQIETRRFTAEELERRAPDLLERSADLAALADLVASWDDELAVAYVGEPIPIEAVISADDSRGEFVLWLDTASSAQFVATNGIEPGSGWFEGLFALGLSDDYTLTEEYFGFTGAGPVVGVTDSEWLLIVDDVLGTDPLVDFPGSELLSTDPGAPRVATPAAEAVRANDGEWTVALRFAEPTTFRDGGGVVATLGGVTLAFGLAEPGVEFTELTVPTRMIEAEARRYAELINGYFADVPPPETTASPYPTTGPIQSGICAANPVPTDDVLDLATHIAADRTPLDLDQDGVDDEMLVYDDADGNWFLLARLQTGWTNALDIGGPTQPGLAQTSDGVPAGTDLDGDGQLEFFVTGYLGPSAQLVTLRSCELVNSFFVDEPAEGLGATVGVQIGFSDDTPLCEGRACATRVRCAGGVLTQELWIGTAVNDDSGSWGAGEIRLNTDGVITTTELPTRSVGPFDPPSNPPTEATTGVIDCAPDRGDGGNVQIARPECAGNAAPAPESVANPVLLPDDSRFDVDGDGFDDELISFVDEDGVRLVLHLGGGNYTNSIPVWFNTPAAGFRPGLMVTADGEIAMADITGNGSREFFVGLFGNTARSASPMGLDGCVLRWFNEADSPGEAFFLVIGVGGNSCAPTGCMPRLSCIDGDLVYEITEPAAAFDPDQPEDEIEVRWRTTVYRYDDGAFVIDRESETTFPFLARGSWLEAPSFDDSDVIDCRPGPFDRLLGE